MRWTQKALDALSVNPTIFPGRNVPAVYVVLRGGVLIGTAASLERAKRLAEAAVQDVSGPRRHLTWRMVPSGDGWATEYNGWGRYIIRCRPLEGGD